jgi:molybdopterin-guanine dinucleotide biosynthesis protein A
MIFGEQMKSQPVYQIGLQDERQQELYAVCLEEELEKRGIFCKLLHGGETLDGYEVMQGLRHHDIVLISGPGSYPVRQIGTGAAAGGLSLNWSEPGRAGVELFADALLSDAALCQESTPVWACVLIGGKSSRMGQPKHLLKDGSGRTWLERVVATLGPAVSGIVLSGRGAVPAQLEDIPRLPDIPGVQGPLNGILSAGRWQPCVSWLLLACDMPEVGRDGVDWLLAGRAPGCWGRVPRITEADFYEPLFAWYDFRAVPLFEQQLSRGNFRIDSVVSHGKITTPLVPGALRHHWQNVNTPEQLNLYRKKEKTCT